MWQYLHPAECANNDEVRHQFGRRSISQQVEQQTLFQRAQTFLQTGETELALAVCTEALERHPEDANFLCLSVRVLTKLERFDEANARIELTQAIYPEFARPHELRGDLLLAQNQPAAAAEVYRQSLKLDPKRQRVRMKLGQVYVYLGRVEEAQALRSEFFEISQDNRNDPTAPINNTDQFEITRWYDEGLNWNIDVDDSVYRIQLGVRYRF